MKGAFYISYALRALRRGGQRTVIAVLCVAFGVMALASMQILAATVADTLFVRSAEILGGDAQIGRSGGYLTGADIARLDQLRQAGEIESYTAYSALSWMLLRQVGSGEVHSVTRAVGVDPATYPPVGEIVLSGAGSLADALAAPDAAAITRDLAHKLDMQVGDRFTLICERGSMPVQLQVSAIIHATPDRLGSMVMYDLETARAVAGRSEPRTVASLRLSPGSHALDALYAAGLSITLPADLAEQNKSMREVFDLMLKGSGILGLLVGGIGVASTMQVILARRTEEIAVLKVLGYRRHDLVLLFGLETALLGVAGSAIGAVGALGLAALLLQTLAQIVSVLLSLSVDPARMAGSVAAGVATTVIFGVAAVLRAAAVRPSVLLRNLPALKTWRRRLGMLGVYALLALPFGLLTSMVMGSALHGAAVIGFALAGLVVLGGLLGGLLWVTVRLPLPGGPLLRLARRNMKRQVWRMVFALIALSTGVFAVGFAVVTILSGRDILADEVGSLAGYNLVALGAYAQQSDITAALEREGTAEIHTRYQLPIEEVQVGGEALQLWAMEIEGRAAADIGWDLSFTGEPWGTVPDGVYLPARFQGGPVDIGAAVMVRTAQGEARQFTVAGFYTPATYTEAMVAPSSSGLLVPLEALDATETAVMVIASLPAAQLEAAAARLGLALPDVIMINAADISNMFNGMLQNLFNFAVAIAGLALVAGAVLIANAVGLVIVERRREIGILKAIGYSSRAVLRTILLEHSLLGVLSGAAGTAAVVVAVAVLNALEPRANLVFYPLPGLVVALASVLIVLAVTVLVAWQPAHVRPLAVLRDGGD
ncbi:MAG: FtsX-like permease family protein [Anaerolineae bacterium]|nr:FtsX-like permease family protein [Anaerolineae bacterium]